MTDRVEPAPDHAERAALPLHLRSAAAALFDDLPDPVPAEAVDRAVADLERGRADLAQRLPEGTELTVDAYRVRLVAGCPASAAGGDHRDFQWTPATAARHLGLRALALHLRGDGPGGQPIERTVRTVMAEHVERGGPRSPGPWLAELDAPGRAVAEAQARRWAEQAVGWLPLRLADPRSLRFLDEDWWPERTGRAANAGGRTLVLHGRRDLTVDVGGRRVAVTVAGGTASAPGAADVDTLTALAATLHAPGSPLVRVVRVHPASGEVVAADIGPDLLDRGVAVVLSTATALAGPAPATKAGPGCTWCDRLEGCPAGTAWMHAPQRRSMGLPIGARPPAARTVPAS
jgi:hypothetical protein